MKKYINKFVALVIIIFLTLPFAYISAESERFFYLVDYADDQGYQIKITDDTVYINSSTLNEELPNSSHFYDCCVYNGVFSFLGYTLINGNLGKQIVVFTYDSKENYQNSFAIINDSSGMPSTFAADTYGRVYFTSSENNTLLYCYSKSGLQYTSKLSANALQLLCLDGKNLTVITMDGVYILRDSLPCLVNTYIPETPCFYAGGGVLMDSANTEYTYEDGNPVKIEPEETLLPTEAPDSENTPQIIENEKYLIVPVGTTVAKLRKALGLNLGEISVTKANGKAITSGKLGTGMKAEYKGLEKYTVIMGELTSEGNINSRDLKLMMKLLTGEEKTTEILLLAGDLDGNGILNTKDLLALSKLY